tara:strand:- start:1129 stop:2466 length:1338 start_codon:yes stop_codon:yes gene_type:complete
VISASINDRIGQRLGRNILTQSLVIGFASIAGVWVAALTLEHVLIKAALEEEAAYYWSLLAKDAETPAPDTQNLTGYLGAAPNWQNIPADLRELPVGYHSLESEQDVKVVYVDDRDAKRLVLVFEGTQVWELALVFGLAPLGLILMVVYVAAWWSYRAAKRAVSPIEHLAQVVNKLDPERPNPDDLAPQQFGVSENSEVAELAGALTKLTQRVNAFVDRERNFTRDASHELRSPLTVIRMAADLLLTESSLDDRGKATVNRIKRAATDMVELVETFLMLARETEIGLEFEPVSINAAVEDEVERTRIVSAGKDVTIELVHESHSLVDASEKLLSVLVGNLLRNAVNYSEAGTVSVRVGFGFVEVNDSGPGMKREEISRAFDPYYRGSPKTRKPAGYGVGLTIVRRLTARFQWPITLDSTEGKGTRVRVEFPSAQALSEHESPAGA